eukprot:522803-Pelagomonas_calceolata.AAC.5
MNGDCKQRLIKVRSSRCARSKKVWCPRLFASFVEKSWKMKVMLLHQVTQNVAAAARAGPSDPPRTTSCHTY